MLSYLRTLLILAIPLSGLAQGQRFASFPNKPTPATNDLFVIESGYGDQGFKYNIMGSQLVTYLNTVISGGTNGGGIAMVGTVSNNIVSNGLLAVDATKTNAIAATTTMVQTTLGNVYQQTNANLTSVASNTFIGSGPLVQAVSPALVTPKSSGSIWTDVDLGTVGNAGTVTLPLATNVCHVIASGATFTIALPTISITTNIYHLRLNVTNTSGGTQVITIPALRRQELDLTVTSITNLIAADATIWCESLNGAWHYCGASGDALRFPVVNNVISAGFDNGASAIATGLQRPTTIVLTSGYITNITCAARETGSIQIQMWKCTQAQYDAGATHPVVGDNITGTNFITIASSYKSSDSTLTGYSYPVTAGDHIWWYVSSVTGLTRVDIAVKTNQ